MDSLDLIFRGEPKDSFGILDYPEGINTNAPFRICGVLRTTNLNALSLEGNGFVEAAVIRTRTMGFAGKILANKVFCGAMRIEGSFAFYELEAQNAVLIPNSIEESIIDKINCHTLEIILKKGRFQVREIQAQYAKLEGVKANKVCADIVEIGPHCNIEELFYHSSFSVDPSSCIHSINTY